MGCDSLLTIREEKGVFVACACMCTYKKETNGGDGKFAKSMSESIQYCALEADFYSSTLISKQGKARQGKARGGWVKGWRWVCQG